MKRKVLNCKELEEVAEGDGSVDFVEKTLKSWGFDTDRDVIWWDDPITGERTIIQKELDDGE